MHAVVREGTFNPAKLADHQMLTSGDLIESAATSGLLPLFDTGGVFIATINPRGDDR